MVYDTSKIRVQSKFAIHIDYINLELIFEIEKLLDPKR
jgi:hypothetical protein